MQTSTMDKQEDLEDVSTREPQESVPPDPRHAGLGVIPLANLAGTKVEFSDDNPPHTPTAQRCPENLHTQTQLAVRLHARHSCGRSSTTQCSPTGWTSIHSDDDHTDSEQHCVSRFS